jgi:hypothetical protein
MKKRKISYHEPSSVICWPSAREITPRHRVHFVLEFRQQGTNPTNPRFGSLRRHSAGSLTSLSGTLWGVGALCVPLLLQASSAAAGSGPAPASAQDKSSTPNSDAAGCFHFPQRTAKSAGRSPGVAGRVEITQGGHGHQYRRGQSGFRESGARSGAKRPGSPAGHRRREYPAQRGQQFFDGRLSSGRRLSASGEHQWLWHGRLYWLYWTD